MTQQLTIKDQLNIALNGSRAFQAKFASSTGFLQPDPVIEGHAVMAGQLNGLANLFAQTAESVAVGYPAKVAMADIAGKNEVDPQLIQKTAAYLGGLANLILAKTQEKTAQSAGDGRVIPSGRAAAALQRFNQLANP